MSGTSPVKRSSSSCTISGGNLTGSFTVANAPPGVYTVTGTGNLIGDFSSYPFTVLPPSIALNPSSGPFGTTVTVTGFRFFTSDNPCTLTGTDHVAILLIDGTGDLSGTFTVASVAPGCITVTVTGNTAAMTLRYSPIPSYSYFPIHHFSIHQSRSVVWSGRPHTVLQCLVQVSRLSDTSCTLSGRIVAAGSSTCSISGGMLNPLPSFTVGNVAPGVYTVTVTGSPERRFGNGWLSWFCLSPLQLRQSRCRFQSTSTSHLISRVWLLS